MKTQVLDPEISSGPGSGNRIRGSLGLDLGTGNVKMVYLPDGGEPVEFPIIPSYVAYHTVTGQPTEFGDIAKRQYGRLNGTVMVEKPLSVGLIKDPYITSLVAKNAANRVEGRRPKMGGVFDRVVISIPYGDSDNIANTDLHCQRMAEVAWSLGAKELFYAPQLVLAGGGAGLPVEDPEGIGMMDIGAGNGQVGILSDAKVKFGKCTNVGGDLIDAALQRYFRMTHGIEMGPSSAEAVKIQICNDTKTEEFELTAPMVGTTDTKTVTVPANELQAVIGRSTWLLAEALFETWTSIPPQYTELRGDVASRPLMISGGSAPLRGLKDCLEELNVKVEIAKDPQRCVIRGITRALRNPEFLKKVTVRHEKRPFYVRPIARARMQKKENE